MAISFANRRQVPPVRHSLWDRDIAQEPFILGRDRWAARAAGLREDQRRLTVMEDGRIMLAHLVPEVEPVPVRRPEPPAALT